ncbi:PHB depolymerase family esterase [Fibrobacter sp. UBA2449]|uniref:PHB depolymerase family esterase n=1 Tax=Fibrobacter sp. UBA2449 TaxID=1946529 RepID=UPI0025B97C70|nr:PHB depolymerase family esterase [Fibrobacter sp. UBA2449]
MKFPLLLLAAATLSFAQWGGGGKNIRDYKKVSVSGRDVYVYAPSGLAENSPLLLSLHGANQDPDYQQSNTHWETVADTAGFVVAYPKGGEGYSAWDISGDQDTKWISAVIDQLVKDYKLNPKRVYLSGFSMGGMFSYHAISKIADKIAAIAPCSGTNVYGASKAQRPMPIFHPHGTKDDVLNYSQVDGFLKNYRDQFKCPSQAEVKENYPNAENKATLYSWGPCDNGVYIKHLKLEGRMHSPSKADISDIWNFVKGYDVDGPIGTAPASSSSEVASSSDVAKSSSSAAATGSSSSHHHWGGISSSTTALPVDPGLLAVSVYKSSDNYIVVAGAQGKTITVFNSLGSVVSTTRALGNQQKVYTGAKGMYIVKVGSRSFKFSL